MIQNNLYSQSYAVSITKIIINFSKLFFPSFVIILLTRPYLFFGGGSYFIDTDAITYSRVFFAHYEYMFISESNILVYILFIIPIDLMEILGKYKFYRIPLFVPFHFNYFTNIFVNRPF